MLKELDEFDSMLAHSPCQQLDQNNEITWFTLKTVTQTQAANKTANLGYKWLLLVPKGGGWTDLARDASKYRSNGENYLLWIGLLTV